MVPANPSHSITRAKQRKPARVPVRVGDGYGEKRGDNPCRYQLTGRWHYVAYFSDAGKLGSHDGAYCNNSSLVLAKELFDFILLPSIFFSPFWLTSGYYFIVC